MNEMSGISKTLGRRPGRESSTREAAPRVVLRRFPLMLALALVVLLALAASSIAFAAEGVPTAEEMDPPYDGALIDPTGEGANFAAQETVPVVPILFPMEERIVWQNTWGAARDGGARSHRGNDLMAPKMTPLLAVVDGTVEWLNMEAEVSSYNGVPSFNIMLRGDDGNDYFYIHLNNDTPGTDDGKGGVRYAYAPGITNGVHVTQGQMIGYVGDSGNAESTGSHLHFELHLGGYADKGASAVDPYPSLMAAPTLAEIGPPRVFKDVWERDWFFGDLMWLYEREIVKGAGDGYFYPESMVTRAQFATMVVRAFAGHMPVLTQSEPPEFIDVADGYWAHDEIAMAAALGVVRGVGDGSEFSPDDSITRAQMAAMICRVLDLVAGQTAEVQHLPPENPPFWDLTTGYWAAGEISRVVQVGVIKGRSDGSFDPEATSWRMHTAVVIARALRTMEAELAASVP